MHKQFTGIIKQASKKTAWLQKAWYTHADFLAFYFLLFASLGSNQFLKCFLLPLLVYTIPCNIFLLCTCVSDVCSCSWLVVSTFCGHYTRTLFISCSAVMIQQWSREFLAEDVSVRELFHHICFSCHFYGKKHLSGQTWLTDDRFYRALFSTIEQIHCILAACDSKWATVLPNNISLLETGPQSPNNNDLPPCSQKVHSHHVPALTKAMTTAQTRKVFAKRVFLAFESFCWQ